MKQNPLEMNRSEKIAIMLGVAGGIGAAIDDYTRPATAATSTTTTPVAPPTPTLVLQPGTLTSPLTVSGLIIALPTGASWTSGVGTALLGTSGSFTIPPATPAMAGQTGTLTLGWTDSNGAAQTTTLTLSS